jgi:hypothetical protein
MADIVTTTILENGPKRAVMCFTNYSDGTGESGVVKVNATSTGPLGVNIGGTLFYAGVHLEIVDLHYDVRSMGLRLQWQATTPTDILILGGFGHWPLRDMRGGFQGLVNPNATGATGSILFSTVNANNYASYTVVLSMVKGIQQ